MKEQRFDLSVKSQEKNEPDKRLKFLTRKEECCVRSESKIP